MAALNEMFCTDAHKLIFSSTQTQVEYFTHMCLYETDEYIFYSVPLPGFAFITFFLKINLLFTLVYKVILGSTLF